MSFKKKHIFIISIVIMAAICIAFRLPDNVLASSRDILGQVRLFIEVLNVVSNYYVDEVSASKLVSGAIRGMLHELDPHTVYIPVEQVEELNENYAGYFDGVGIEFVIQNKIPTVIAPIMGGPSELLGIKSGDRILKIDADATYEMSEEEVKERLRGVKGSKVVLTIKRPGVLQPFKINVWRDRIPIYSIICYFMIDEKTGYIRIGSFSQSTATELEHALRNLERMGMSQLLLDLRSNSGGLLEQAYAVADKFIAGGKKIVYTKGRMPNSHEDFYATDYNTHADLPLIVLIDRGSASASEIVAGAIQDWDRGLIVGETSFGKALVQSHIPLSDGSAVRVTVARYYTPCGRLIQRSYKNGLLDYFGNENENLFDNNVVTPYEERPKYQTKGGRIIYGGGGIVPDYTINSRLITNFTNQLISNNLFFEYGSIFAASHRELAQNFQTFKARFEVSDEMLEEFKRLLMRRDIVIDETAFQQDISFYKHQLKSEIARHLWNSQYYFEVQIMGDSQIVGAQELFDKAMLLEALH